MATPRGDPSSILVYPPPTSFSRRCALSSPSPAFLLLPAAARGRTIEDDDDVQSILLGIDRDEEEYEVVGITVTVVWRANASE
jgi:hypothetical protein